MPQRVKTIDIQAFRGIPNLRIPLEGRSLLLKGENGTGKSSVVEAFEFFFTGGVSHLEGTQGISASRHGPHVDFSENDVTIEVAFDPGDVHVSRTFAAAPNPPKQLTQYFTSASRGAFILKRSQILQFIVDRPADRFRALASIIGVDTLDEIELEMMRARDDLAGELQAIESERLGLLAGLSDDLGTNISSIEDVLPHLNTLLGQSNLPPISSLQEIEAHAEAMLRSVRSVDSVETVSRLTVAFAQAKSPLFPDTTSNKLGEFVDIAKPLLNDKIQLELRLSDLLQNGHDIIEEEELSSCPLCQQPIERKSLLTTLKERTSVLQSLTEGASNVRKLTAYLSSIIQDAESRVSTLRTAIETVGGASSPSIALLKDFPIFTVGPRHISEAGELRSPLPIDELQKGISQAEEQWQHIEKEIEDEITRLGVTPEEKILLQMVRLIGAVKDKVERLYVTQERASRLGRMGSDAQFIYQTFSEVKSAKITEIYNTIQADIRSYYSVIHPGEDHTDITLRLRSGQRASTELRIRSFGRDDEDPRALTSEGHLDSLGLCIFLAFVKNFNVDCTLVILDDVVTTIDSTHRSRICYLLLQEFSSYQLVVTTHDGIWYKEFTAAQRALGFSASFLNLEIESWSRDNGPQIEKFLPRVDLIRQKIDKNDKTGAGNATRQYLEWLLKHIARSTNASIPVVNWQIATVGALTPFVRARLMGLSSDPEYLKNITQAWLALERTTFFANLLSHDNELAERLSITEVKEFFDAVQALHLLVCCPSCGNELRYVNDTREFRCVAPKCSAPRIIPVK